MIRKWFSLGILGLVVVILSVHFFSQAVLYSPLEGKGRTAERADAALKKAPAGFKRAWTPDIQEKNLFSQARGYVAPAPPPGALNNAVPEPPQRPDFTLRGIMAEKGYEVAILDNGKGRTFSARVGDVVDNAQVMEIGEKDVKLRWMQEDIVLSIEKVKTLKRLN
jgi:hypothetical protein